MNEDKYTRDKFNATISSCWGYLFILSSAIDRLTDQVAGCAGWQVIVRKLKRVPFLIFFPLCIICRYLLYSQDQHVSPGGSALDRNLMNMDES